MLPSVFAQALLEKGMLDGAVAGISGFFNDVTHTVQDNPYLLIGVAIVLALLLLKKRR